jgi:hypothetical protein
MMSTMMIALYAAGTVVALMGMLVAAPHFGPDQSVPRRGAFAVLGASLWPILVVGLLEFASVVAYRKVSQNQAPSYRRLDMTTVR